MMMMMMMIEHTTQATKVVDVGLVTIVRLSVSKITTTSQERIVISSAEKIDSFAQS